MKIFYDNSCPLCSSIAKLIKLHDKNNNISTIDISSPSFIPEIWGLDKSVWDIPHGILNNGEIVTGPNLVRQIFRALNFWCIYCILGKFPILYILKFIVNFVIKNRKHISRFL